MNVCVLGYEGSINWVLVKIKMFGMFVGETIDHVVQIQSELGQIFQTFLKNKYK